MMILQVMLLLRSTIIDSIKINYCCSVGKTLRDISLGAKYTGKKISRKQLEEEEEENIYDNNEEDIYDNDNDDENNDEVDEEDETEKKINEYGKKWDKVFADLEYESEQEDEDDESIDNEEEEEEDMYENRDEIEEEGSDNDNNKVTMEANNFSAADELLKQLEEEEAKIENERVSKVSSGKVTDDINKAMQTKNQQTLWDSFLDIRIRIQRNLNTGNQLPQYDILDNFEKSDKKVKQQLKRTYNSTCSLLSDMLELQIELMRDNSEINSTISSDVTDNLLEQLNNKKRKITDEKEKEDVEEWWNIISKIDDEISKYEYNTIDKWSRKVQLSSKNTEKQFKAINKSVLDQVNHILLDKEKLRKRTQLKRTNFKILGKITNRNQENNNGGDNRNIHINEYDDEIFDDTDFYQQLLKELIETTTTDTDTVNVNQYWLENNSLRKKMKKAVQRKATKGRAIRYEVHEKLVGFMAPDKISNNEFSWRPEDLYTNLFGGQSL